MKIPKRTKKKIKNLIFLIFITISIIIFNQKLTIENNVDEITIMEERRPINLTSNIVLLVQVHKRINYLEQLIKSLRNTRYIENSMVIFSHDYIDESIDKLINTIDFCKVNNRFLNFYFL